MRRRQCNFKVVEAQDGGIVVCGNTGHNFDDAYLVKLAPPPCPVQIAASLDYPCELTPTAGGIDVTLSGGIGPYSYYWSNGATTQDLTGLGPGTYTLTVVDHGNGDCTSTSVHVLPAIMQFSFAFDRPCGANDHTGSITTTMTGGSGSVLAMWQEFNSGNMSPGLNLNSARAGNYTFTVLDNVTGCTSIHFPYLPPGPSMGITAALIHANCGEGITGAIDLTISDPENEGPHTFYWSTGATTEDLSGLAPGTYTVTVSDAGVCSSIRTFEILEMQPCCAAAVVIPDGTLASSIGSGLGSTTVDIRGEFIVDNTFAFSYAQIKMEPGSRIIVQAGKTLDLYYANVMACSSMWDGIVVEPGGSLNSSYSDLADARYCVQAKNGSFLNINSTVFDRNYVGIRLADVPGLPQVPIVNLFYSDFTASAPLKPPYAGQTPAPGTKPLAGIEVYNTWMDLSYNGASGPPNRFIGLSNGVRAYKSDLVVDNCYFENIQPDNTYNVPYNGSGIYGTGLGSAQFLALDQIGFGKNGSYSFKNCNYGIYAERMSVNSHANNMYGVGTAYQVESGGARNIWIHDNKLDTDRDGIILRFNDGAASLLVEENDLLFARDPVGGVISAQMFNGIRVDENGRRNGNSIIRNNDIVFRANTVRANTGIRITAAHGYLVAGNQLTMTSNTNNVNGIHLNGCSTTEVSCNTVLGAGTSYPTNGQAGIRNTMGTSPLISCNDVDRTTNGILFVGPATGTDVRGNQIRRHQWGLFLDNFAIIGIQNLKGNLWYDLPAPGGWGAFCTSPNNAFANPFLYNPATINGGSTQPPTWSPLNWFLPTNGTNYDCENHHGVDYCGLLRVVRDKEKVQELDERIANDELENEPYTEETRWMLKGDLYDKLDDHPELRDSVALMADFHAELEGSTIAGFKLVKDEQLPLYAVDSTVVTALEQNRLQVQGRMALAKEVLAQLAADGLTVEAQGSLEAALLDHQQAINDLVLLNATALEAAHVERMQTADGTKATNAALETSAAIELNEQQVNDLYLSTVAKDITHFTPEQAALLLSIADQCPMLGGNAVFRARALYALVDEAQQYDDEALCLAHGIVTKSVAQQTVLTLQVVPNPANAEATLMLDRTYDRPVVLVLYNALGAMVQQHTVPARVQRFAFATEAWATGLYRYTVADEQGLLGHGQLSIVH